MPNLPLPPWESIHTLIFDFDGVFTNNKVWVDQAGNEWVRCDRGDGLAFDLLRTFMSRIDWPLQYFILSKEKNPVVLARANKLKIPCHQGISHKLAFVKTYLSDRFSEEINPQKGLIYLGNDLNDLAVMRFAGYSVAPSDAHPVIQQSASRILEQRGGEGFVRAFIELFLGIDQLDVDTLLEIV
ncbi:hypothetical protein [Phormidium sp. FACHB-1136]|uniref:KdsC family phosphatase n=1 Tax=Phormidium sp. FACHB-1136 TaxID=2692848 RepID=UPI0016880C2E|nr:hypothetical protein [Phormidium sp. FACHB-1136]MBD2428490.1 hypothetical protein [Phormidium sp. FACHB-1136]